MKVVLQKDECNHRLIHLLQCFMTLTVSCEYKLIKMIVSVDWKVTDKMESTERKNCRRYDETIQSWRQICHAIRIAIIRYYSKAHSLCYPTIETGNTRCNLMTHKSWCFWLQRASLECFTPFFHLQPEIPPNPFNHLRIFHLLTPEEHLFNVKTL